MRTSIIISALLHLCLLAGAVVWGKYFTEPPEPPEPVMTVQLTPSEVFDEPEPPAPEVKQIEQALAAPQYVFDDIARPDIEQQVVTNDITGPDTPSDPDQSADLTELRSLARNRVVVNNQVVESKKQDTASQTASIGLSSPRMGLGRPSSGLSRPGMARPGGTPSNKGFKVPTSTSPPPPKEEDKPKPSEPDTPDEPEVEAEDSAEDTELAGVAPETMARPPMRPAREAEQPSTDDPEAASEEAKPASDGEPEVEDPGPPLTDSEKGGVRIAFESVWNKGRVTGLPNYEDLVVTVGFKLDRDGKVVGENVYPIEPENPDGAFKVAFQAARSAILQASRAGLIDLPVEKYAHWKEVEVTFDPGQGIGGL